MGYKLVVTEKPSVAGDIANAIGANSKKSKYYEGNGYRVTWCLGHLVALSFPESYDTRYAEWKLEDLPIIPSEMKTEVISKVKDQYKAVSELMNDKDTDIIICATDAGREGEYIFGLVYRQAKCKKAVKRLWISSMTDTAIQDGLSKLKDGEEYKSLYESANCRGVADWLVGLNATRLYSLKHKTKLSVGRVQTPTLAMIVNRHNEIVNFKPVKYYEVKVLFEGYSGLWTDAEGNKINDEKKALEIVEKVRGKNGTVKKVETTDKSKANPLLYDLTQLQRDGNKVFGYSAKDTLDIAQALYEKHKLTTYPRTDSRYLTDDMIDIIKPTLEKLKNPRLTKYIDGILKAELPISKRIIDNSKVSDHHAIIPTNKEQDTSALNEKEKNIYELICKRFVSVFLPKHDYKETIVETVVSDETFISRGKIVVNMGWLELEGKETNEEENSDEQNLPALKEGQPVKLLDATKLDKLTKPKKEFDEDTLLSAMENCGRDIEDEALKEQMKDKGLGTPATRASIIEKLLDTQYIERVKKNLIPTDKGIKLIEIVPDMLKKAELTGEWELQLNNIAKKKQTSDVFLGTIKKFVYAIMDEGNKDTDIVINTQGKHDNQEVIGVCPRCGCNVYENAKSFSCEGYKNDPKCTFSLWKEDKFFTDRGKTITVATAKKLLKNGKAEIKKLKSKQGKEYDAVFIMDDTGKYINFKMEFLNKK